jgi:hypothetical protein
MKRMSRDAIVQRRHKPFGPIGWHRSMGADLLRILRNAAFLFVALMHSGAQADLRFVPRSTDSGVSYVVVEGSFAYEDDLDGFVRVISSHNPTAVLFNSPGGNVSKAIELGRLIRAAGIYTMQPRGAECASACALAFLGGVQRFAEPGSIGVHRSSFSNTQGMSVEDAVTAIQRLTADVMSYISEMGADPGLMQLALQYDSADMRYLSLSEMDRYRVTTGNSPAIANPTFTSPATSARQDRFAIPEARSGIVRHPKRQVTLMAEPDDKAIGLATIKNGTTVDIVGTSENWFRVAHSGTHGFLHQSWVAVREYETAAFDKRFIQVRSFSTYADAESFVRHSTLPVAAYLASNGWFAIVLRDAMKVDNAIDLLKSLKASKAIPDDAFVTYGNTYVRRVCCD